MRAATVARIARREVKEVLEDTLEVKYTDTTGSGNAIASLPYAITPTAVPQGTDWFQRLGSRSRGVYVRTRFTLAFNAAGAASTVQNVRFLAVRDMDQAGTGLILNNLLGSALFHTSTDPTLNTLPSPLARARYQVLRDEVYVLSDGTQRQRVVDWYHSGPMIVEHLNTGTTFTSQGPGTLYLIWISDRAADGPGISHYTRYAFTDA